jgi:uncharacterized repeat protein (TIGR02543 family)
MNKNLKRVLTTLGCFAMAITAVGFAACSPTATGSASSGNNSTAASYTVTFTENYTNCPVPSSSTVDVGEKVAQPSTPTRDMYIFDAWYTDADCTTKYDFDAAVTADMTLYAGWTKDASMEGKVVWTFEAEQVDLSKFKGAGYSGGATKSGAILTDWDGTAKASDGLYVSYLYQKGDDTKLTFTITSDTEVDNATLKLRLSGEFMETVSFSCDEWQVIVNGTALSYNPIKITGCRTDTSEDWVREFQDFTITKKLHLNKGENTIVLYTNNSNAMVGTMYATAPMVDCMKIITDDTVTLSWDPVHNADPYYGED